jgi:hypothetical protein
LFNGWAIGFLFLVKTPGGAEDIDQALEEVN